MPACARSSATRCWRVSFGINDGLQALKESGTPIAQCSLVGGGARSPFWAQLLADILAMPVVTHKGGETGGALGAARLACGCGQTGCRGV